MYTILKAKTNLVREQAIQFTSDLIKTQSYSLNEKDVASLVKKKCDELMFDEVFTDEFGNVVAIIYGSQTHPVVLLNSHMDTVMPEEGGFWDVDPLSAHVEDGKMYGLGASDCKSGLAAQLFGAAVLKHSMLPLKGTLIFSATAAEENGRSVGMRGLLDVTLPALELKPDYVVLGEPTDLEICYGHDGWVTIDIHVAGYDDFHVEDAAMAIYEEFREANGSGNSGIEIMPPHYIAQPGTRHAMMRVNRRLHKGENIESVTSAMKRNILLATQGSGVAVDVAVAQEEQHLYTGKTIAVANLANAWETDPFSPLIDRARQGLAAAGFQTTPAKWHLRKTTMGTAGGLLVNHYGIPTIGFGPGSPQKAHEGNEFVVIDNIPRAIYGTAAICHSIAGIPVFGWTVDEI